MVQDAIKKDSIVGPHINPNEVFSQKTVFQDSRHAAINFEKSRFKYNRKGTYTELSKNKARTEKAGMPVEIPSYSSEINLNCES
jgi:hypothetical protein